MFNKHTPPSRRSRAALPLLSLAAAAVLATLTGCGSSADERQTVQFTEGPIVGLDVAGQTSGASRSDAAGQISCAPGESLTVAIGKLALGSAACNGALTALALTPGATSAADRKVHNKLILLQTLDADGDLNNGIQISEGIRSLVSTQAASINFDQATTAFRTSLTPLMTALNGAAVFTDTDPRPRSVRAAAAALEHYGRATAPRQVVTTTHGQLSGFEANAGTWQFLGIPYAKPPLGELRWRPPQPLAPWSGVRQAVAWADQAAQNPGLERFGEGGMSEDSLYLNVTAPKNASKLPVMVWFHGGGFTSLTSNTKPFNNPLAVASKGVVQVAVNQRLGPFGYIAHPALSQESGYGGSGNYGQMDLIAALKWVKANIAAFGGDPDNVTIFGESGGGRKVLSLMASPQAAGLFHKAISQSGTLHPDTRSLTSAEAIGATLQANLKAASLAEMRARPWTDIVTASAALVPYTNVDLHYLPTTERVRFESRQHNDVPFMLVVNTFDTEEPIATVKNVLPWMTTHSSKNHYAALFSHVPAGWQKMGLKAYHGIELLYVFNYLESVVTHFQLNLVLDPKTNARVVIGDLNGNGVTGTAGDSADVLASAGFDATDTAVVERTLTMWTNFAKTGNPSTSTLSWPIYTPATDAYVELGATAVARTGLSKVFP